MAKTGKGLIEISVCLIFHRPNTTITNNITAITFGFV